MSARRSVESLSRRQREATPPELARQLVELVRTLCGVRTVAVLWIQARSVYETLGPDLDLWGVERDARLYAGPHPLVAHPPCGPWGKYRSRCQQSPVDGLIALELVHRWGGVVEQPLGSSLFREYGRGGHLIEIDQAEYGHPAQKRTRLYIVPGTLAPGAQS